MARWKQGRYGTHFLTLANGIEATVSWSTVKNDPKPYRIRLLGDEVGGAETFDGAKRLAETSLEKRLSQALAELRTEEPPHAE